MIALVDYGAGNLTSVKKALTSLGASFVVSGRAMLEVNRGTEWSARSSLLAT